MGRDRHENKKHHRLPPFVPLLNDTIDSRAWRALSHGAKALYVALKRRHNVHAHNNGRLFLSQRHAVHELGSNRTYVARWYRELEYYGFIVQTTPGCLGLDGKGKSPTWRLTELGTHADSWPTRDFMKWSGIKFRDAQKQNPGPQTGATVDHKLVPVVDHKLVPPNPESGPQTGAIAATQGGPQTGSITSKPLHRSNLSSLNASPQLVAVEDQKNRARRRGV